MIRFALFAAVLLGFLSCDNSTIFEERHEFDVGSWGYDQEAVFEFEISDTTALYDLYFTLNHGKDYAYQNLYLKAFTLFPDGSELNDPLSLEMANKAGKWYGKCSGSSCKLTALIQKDAFFNQLGKYKLRVIQFMRTDPVKDIKALQFKIRATGKTRKN